MTLIEFLLARIAEDEAAARGAGGDGWRPENSGYEEFDWIVGPSREEGPGVYRYVVTDQPQADHIARWDPARVLTECEAKRRIVAEHSPETEDHGWDGTVTYCQSCCYDNGLDRDIYPCHTLSAVASVYADHPDYRAEWRP